METSAKIALVFWGIVIALTPYFVYLYSKAQDRKSKPLSNKFSDWPELQRKLAIWQDENFPPTPELLAKRHLHLAMGVGEEAGELLHATLKRDQGIRGSKEELEAKMQDAIGDNVVFLMQLCSHEGWDFEHIVVQTAEQVLQRKWK